MFMLYYIVQWVAIMCYIEYYSFILSITGLEEIMVCYHNCYCKAERSVINKLFYKHYHLNDIKREF